MLHILSMKPRTKRIGIVPLPDPDVLYVPLLQHIGRPAIPLVKAGDRVARYQLIGQAAEGLSANIHAPVSGCVREVGTMTLVDGTPVPGIIIDNDHQGKCAPELPALGDEGLTLPDLIKAAGIVGMGGAQFPTDVKYRVGDQPIHTLIINATECEPYLTADYALIHAHRREVLEAVALIQRTLGADRAVITVEQQNAKLADLLAPYFTKEPFTHIGVKVLADGYPQGGELQLIRSVTGIEVPRTQLPKDAGVIVSNVGTVYAIYRAVHDHRPLVSRCLTVSGEQAERIGNFEVCIGTPVSHIIRHLGLTAQGKALVMGGPMMGKPVCEANGPIVKGSSGLLLLTPRSEESGHCISCGYCVEACPMHLMPMKFEENLRRGKIKRLADYGLMNCIECAACQYICPANVPLLASIRQGKVKLKELQSHDAKK